MAIDLAYYNGHANVVKWLEETFHIYRMYYNTSMFYNTDFRSACEYGKLDLVKNIIERKRLNIKDITYANNLAFRMACTHGYYDIVEWLEETYGVIEKSDDIVALYEDVCNSFIEDQLPAWIVREIKSVMNSCTDYGSDYSDSDYTNVISTIYL